MKGFRYYILFLLFGFSVKLAEAQPSPPPVISISGFTGNISTCYGLASASFQQFTVGGSNLNDAITLSLSSAGFQISLNSTNGFDTTLILTPALGLVKATNIYVRSSADAPVGNLSANVVINSSGAITQNIPVAASVYAFPNKPVITPDGATTICSGNNITLTSSTLSGNQWYKNDTLINGVTTVSFSPKSSGDYSVISTVNGCSSSKSDVVSVKINPTPATPTIGTTGSTTICSGDSVLLSSTAVISNQWYLNDTIINSATSASYGAKKSGNYTVISTLNGCSSAKSNALSVTVNNTPAAPVITPAGSTKVCGVGNVTMTSSAANGNQWYLNDTVISGAVSPSYIAKLSGNYTVISTINGCSSTKSGVVLISINPIPLVPVITASGSTTICKSDSAVLSSSSVSGNQWYFNDTLINGAVLTSYNAKDSGNYSVITTLNGCSSPKSKAIFVTVYPLPPKPVINTGGAITICNGTSVTLTSSVTTANQWYLDGAPIGLATTTSYSASQAGTYTDTVTNSNGCKNGSLKTIIAFYPAPPKPSITWNGSQFSTSAIASKYQWLLNDVLLSGATSSVYKPSTIGNYKVQTMDNNGCTSTSDNFTLIVTAVSNTVATPNNHLAILLPNPASTTVIVRFNQPPVITLSIQIIDISGRILKQVSTRNQYTYIPLIGITAGNYYCKITGKSYEQTQQLIISH